MLNGCSVARWVPICKSAHAWATNEVDAIVSLRDPMTPQPHGPDINALVRASDVHDIPRATNLSTAGLMLRQWVSAAN